MINQRSVLNFLWIDSERVFENYYMKKRLINEPIGFFVLLFLTLGLLSFLLISLIYAHSDSNPFAFRMIALMIYSPTALFCLVWLTIKTEFISVNNEEIKSFKIFRKRVAIRISEIKKITNQKIVIYGIDSPAYPCWKIEDHSGNAIYIIQYKIRRKIIDSIQETINS